MCGITGIYSHGPRQDQTEQLIKLMNDTQAHRGPDGDGYYCDNQVALGHRRLSIIDIDGGAQPIYNEEKSIVIVFNGEIYNYKEIRAELIKKGHKFYTSTDTEAIVHLYEEMGVGCLELLNGMFSFAIWDIKKRKMFIARDRAGEKPLYYTKSGTNIFFASELKAIVKATPKDLDVDTSSLDDYLSYGYIPCPKTIYKNINKLPPGHYMEISEGRINISQYWAPDITCGNNVSSLEESIEHLNYLLNESVRIRLRSDVPVGAFLSGGIDSSLIVSLAATQSSNRIQTFSVGFSEKDFDELQYARVIAEKYNTDHHEIVLGNIDIDILPDVVNQFDEPFADPSALPTYYVTREAAKHLKVCLSGDAGDELFCGYGRYRAALRTRHYKYIPLSIRKNIFEKLAGRLDDSISGKGALMRLASNESVRWQRTVGIFDSADRENLWLSDHKSTIDDSSWLFDEIFKRKDLDIVSKAMLADQRNYLTDDVLVKVDRNSMWNSLEVRVPLLDHRIIEYANSMPLAHKYHDGIQKYPIKEILKRFAPKEIIERRKTGFGMPIKHWLKSKYYDYTKELLLSNDSMLLNYFDKNAINELIQQNKIGKRDLSRKIWSLMCFELWCRSNS